MQGVLDTPVRANSIRKLFDVCQRRDVEAALFRLLLPRGNRRVYHAKPVQAAPLRASAEPAKVFRQVIVADFDASMPFLGRLRVLHLRVKVFVLKRGVEIRLRLTAKRRLVVFQSRNIIRGLLGNPSRNFPLAAHGIGCYDIARDVRHIQQVGYSGDFVGFSSRLCLILSLWVLLLIF